MVNRRLIGPTVICLIMSALLADYLLLSDSPWSVSAFLSKIVSATVIVFGPALNPVFYRWLDDLVVPAIIVVLALVTVWLTIAWAKSAMTKATPNLDEGLALELASAIPQQPQAIVTEPESSTESKRSANYRLAWKLTLSFGALAFAFGVVASIIAYRSLASTVEKEAKGRARLSLMALSEVAGSSAIPRRDGDFRRVLDNHRGNSSIAYVYLEDSKGNIVDYIPGELPRFVRRDFPATAIRAIKGVDTNYQGLPVFEIAARVGELDGGYAHLAIWQDIIEEEIERNFMPIAAGIFLAVSAAIAAFAWIAFQVTGPLADLVRYANHINDGEFEFDLDLEKDSGELRDLGHSIARMRSSLHAVFVRSKQAPPPRTR